jgi:hypothetical protein
MKKLFVFIILVALSAINYSAKAQFDYAGGGVAIATGAELDHGDYTYYNKSFGFDLRASYSYNKKLKIVPDFKFFLPAKEEFMSGGESNVTNFALNINAHLIMNPKSRDSYRLYLLAGAHIGAWKIKDNRVALTETLDVNEFKIVPGVNVGGGMEFKLGNRTKFFAEVKYVIAKANQLVFTPGIIYNI